MLARLFKPLAPVVEVVSIAIKKATPVASSVVEESSKPSVRAWEPDMPLKTTFRRSHFGVSQPEPVKSSAQTGPGA